VRRGRQRFGFFLTQIRKSSTGALRLPEALETLAE
jgi:hypothetical protein